jgi:hypothetical protein
MVHGIPCRTNNCSASQEILCFYETKRFVTIFTRAWQWTESWATWNQFIPLQTIFLRSSLILSSYPYLHLLNGLFLRNFLTKILYAFLIYPMCTVSTFFILTPIQDLVRSAYYHALHYVIFSPPHYITIQIKHG